MDSPSTLTGKLITVFDPEETGYDETGFVTPLELVTPEDRIAWKEEHMSSLLHDHGMTAEEIAIYIAFAHELKG